MEQSSGKAIQIAVTQYLPGAQAPSQQQLLAGDKYLYTCNIRRIFSGSVRELLLICRERLEESGEGC